MDASGVLAATGSADSTVKVWDVDKGYCTHNFRGHSGVVSAVKFHPQQDKYWLVSGGDDATVRVWDLLKKTCVFTLKGHVSVIRGLDFTPDGYRLISGSRDKVMNVWELRKGTLLKTIATYETLEAVGVVTNLCTDKATVVFTAGDKGQVRLWNIDQGGQPIQQQAKQDTSKFTYYDALYLPQSDTIIAVTSDQSLLFYPATSLVCNRQLIGTNDEVLDVRFLPPYDNLMAVASNSEQFHLYDLQSSSCSMVYGHSDIVLCMDWQATLGVLATGSKDSTARLWTLDPEAPFMNQLQCFATCVGHTESIGSIALSKKSASFVVTASQDKTLKVWDMATLEGNETKLHARYTVHAHDKDINCVDVSINDKYIATASQDKLCKLWAAEDGKLLGTFKGHKRGVWCVRFSPVDQVIATSSGDTTIRIWSLSDMSCLKTFEGHANSVLNLRFITAGMQLVSCGSDGLVKVWNIKTEECTATLDKHEDKIWALAVDAGEKNIVSGSADSTMTFWEDVTEEETQRQMEEKKEQVEKQQKLSNYIMAKEYGSALLLALELDKPRQLLALFVTMLERSQDDAERHDAVRTFVQTLDTPHLIQLLHYLCDWNTHSKNAFIAQNVLHMILQQHQPSELIKIAPIKDILSKLIPYTERHYESMDRMIVDTYLLDYTLKCMNL